LKLAGPSLVQIFIGDGAKLVRDAFALAKEKTPAIIFIHELPSARNDLIQTKAGIVKYKEPCWAYYYVSPMLMYMPTSIQNGSSKITMAMHQ
jgi:hypothetical protein